MSDTPIEFEDAVQRTVDALDRLRTPYAIIGGIAAARLGIARPTRDIDVLLALEKVRIPLLMEAFQAGGFSVDPEAAIRQLSRDGLSSVFCGHTRVDLLLPVLPLFARVIGRAASTPLFGRSLRLATPEDVVALKLIAGRDVDWKDIQGILAAQSGRLDLAYLRMSAGEILPSTDSRLERLESLFRRYGAPPIQP